MMIKSRFTLLAAMMMILCAAVLCSMVVTGGIESGVSAAPSSGGKRGDSPRRPLRVGHPTFSSPHASPIAVHRGNVIVVNTPADTVDVIDAKTRKVRTRINVGVDPVSVAVRPDGKEVWVSNHVSDSVSVIDNDRRTARPTCKSWRRFSILIQSRRRPHLMNRSVSPSRETTKRTSRLSSENQIAVSQRGHAPSDQASPRSPAQDPRAITIHGDRLYVIPVRVEQQDPTFRRFKGRHRR